MIAVVSSITIPIAFGFFGSMITVYMVYKNHWRNMNILRKKLSIYKLWRDIHVIYDFGKCLYGLFHISCWFSCCSCRKYETKNVSQNENYEIHQWGKFLEETVFITEPDLDNMIKSYINYKYDHKYYYYKYVGEISSPSECKHAKFITMERLLRYPTFYLRVLDYDKSIEYRKIKGGVTVQSIDCFNIIFGPATQRDKKDIESSLQGKFKHLCLVSVNFQTTGRARRIWNQKKRFC